jgi:hypothetical protein
LSELQAALKMIEELRMKLNKMSEGKRVNDPEVVSASHRLDAALNEYHKLIKDKANRS